MAEGKDQDKTEPATPKRREEARKKGEVAQSKEVPSVFVLLVSLFAFYFFGSYIAQNFLAMMYSLFNSVGTFQINDTNVYTFFTNVLRQMGMVLAPLMLSIMVAGVVANVLQKGILFTAEPLIPKLSKLDPIKGAAKMFSVQSLAELLKSLFKIAIVGYMAFITVKGEQENLLPLMMMEPISILAYIGKVSFKICIRIIWVLVPFTAIDYAFQLWHHQQKMKMSKQEIKDESKQREGDPLVKGRIRSIQREMARRRMMEEVPKADVVITNPTELAVALTYNNKEMPAPKVTAKGSGFIAERIREIARKNGVPIVENKPLAKSLFRLVDIEQYIPSNLYKAVAEVLAYVYRLKNRY